MSRSFKHGISANESSIEISEQNGVRSLHLGGSMIQSSMRLAAPNNLELLYTQCMMGFLLFHPDPAHILMIGLGGGSLAKFIHHKMLETKTTVIEINPQIVTTAHHYFALPAEDDRLQIIVAEGSEYIARQASGADILMIDGFNDGHQTPSLCTQDFYNNSRNILNKNGILVINLLSRDKGLNHCLRHIENSFNGHIVTMLSEIRGNLIVFAFKQNPGRLTWQSLKTQAKALEEKYSLPFPKLVSKLRQQSLHDGHYLRFRK